MPQALDPLPLCEVTLVGRVSRHLSHNTRCIADRELPLPNTLDLFRDPEEPQQHQASPLGRRDQPIAGYSVQRLWGFDGRRFGSTAQQDTGHEGEEKNKLLKMKLRS